MKINKRERRRRKKLAADGDDDDDDVTTLFTEDSTGGATGMASYEQDGGQSGSRSEKNVQHQSKRKRKKEQKQAAVTIQNFHPSVMKLQKTLEEIYPDFTDLSNRSELGFQPHLSLGQFSFSNIESKMEQFKRTWKDEVFTVDQIYLISRKDFDDPFHIRHTVKLGEQ